MADQTPTEKLQSGASQFPPYGLMTEGFQDDMANAPQIPDDFVQEDLSLPRDGFWKQKKTEVIAILANTLWPQWDSAAQQWIAPGYARMVALTLADLKIGNALRAAQKEKPMPGEGCPTNKKFYLNEDTRNWFEMYQFYDSVIPPAISGKFADLLDSRGPAKYGIVPLEIKVEFQRPRPFQTAFLLGQPLRPVRSLNASTPSFCSGHSLQGLLGVGAVIENLILRNTTLPAGSWNALRQLSVDIGDRRVYAGVHYPSDNIASWIAGMRLARHVYRSPLVKAHLWHAISGQSRVFKEIQAEPVYAAALKELAASAADVQNGLAGLPDSKIT